MIKNKHKKKNNSPSEMTAEQKRAADRKEVTDNTRNKNSIIIGSLLIIILLGIGLGYMYIASTQNASDVEEISDEIIITADTTRPTIVTVSPANSNEYVGMHDVVSIRFNEQMDVSTINIYTITVDQMTTSNIGSQYYRSRQIEGKVTYGNLIATFTPNEKFTPNQEYGNVFTVTVTNGAMDLAGNSLSQDYVWSFTTGGNN